MLIGPWPSLGFRAINCFSLVQMSSKNHWNQWWTVLVILTWAEVSIRSLNLWQYSTKILEWCRHNQLWLQFGLAFERQSQFVVGSSSRSVLWRTEIRKHSRKCFYQLLKQETVIFLQKKKHCILDTAVRHSKQFNNRFRFSFSLLTEVKINSI